MPISHFQVSQLLSVEPSQDSRPKGRLEVRLTDPASGSRALLHRDRLSDLANPAQIKLRSSYSIPYLTSTTPCPCLSNYQHDMLKVVGHDDIVSPQPSVLQTLGGVSPVYRGILLSWRYNRVLDGGGRFFKPFLIVHATRLPINHASLADGTLTPD